MSKEKAKNIKLKLPTGKKTSVNITKKSVQSMIVNEMNKKFPEFIIRVDTDVWLLKYKHSYQRDAEARTTIIARKNMKDYIPENFDNIQKLSDKVLFLRVLSNRNYKHSDPKRALEKSLEKYLIDEGTIVTEKTWTENFITEIRQYMKKLHVDYAVIGDFFYDPYIIPLHGQHDDAIAYSFWKNVRRLRTRELTKIMKDLSNE